MIVAVSNNPEPLGLTICDESDAVVELCMSCPYDDCISPDRGCPEMRKLKEAQRTGKKYTPPENWGTVVDTDPQAMLDKAFAKMEKKSAKPKPDPKPKQPAITLEELPRPIQNTQLHKYNEAIRALEELQPYAFNMDVEIVGMLGTLKSDRAAKFDHLVDWDAIARGGRK